MSLVNAHRALAVTQLKAGRRQRGADDEDRLHEELKKLSKVLGRHKQLGLLHDVLYMKCGTPTPVF